MSEGRDSQRSKVYDAEHMAFTYTTDFTTVREAQAFSNSITGSRWWRALGGPTFVLIKRARSDSYHSSAWGRRNEIRLSGSTFTKWVLIHELAHIAMWHLDQRLPAHGPDFALVYSRIVEEFLGDDARLTLVRSFDHTGAKAHSNSTRVLKALAAAGETKL